MKTSTSSSRPYSANATSGNRNKTRPPWNISQHNQKSLRFDTSRGVAPPNAVKRPKSASARSLHSRPQSATAPKSFSRDISSPPITTSDAINASSAPTTPKSRPRSAAPARQSLFVDTSSLAATPIISGATTPNPSPLLRRMSLQLYADLAANIAQSYNITAATATSVNRPVSAKVRPNHKTSKSPFLSPTTSPKAKTATPSQSTANLFASYAPPVTMRTRHIGVAAPCRETQSTSSNDAWLNPQSMSVWPHSYK